MAHRKTTGGDVHEAQIEETPEGRVAVDGGWFILNAPDPETGNCLPRHLRKER